MNLQPRSRKLLMAVLIFLAVPVFFLLQAGETMFSRQGVLLAAFFGSNVKTAATDFELTDLNGGLVRLSKFRGDRPVLLYFWATWCPYCVTVRPELAKMRERISRSQMEILAINVGGGDSLEKVKKYQEGHPSAWPVLYDGEGRVSKAYKVQGIPLFVLIDKEGNVVYRDTNPPSDVYKYLQ
jgi:thiol-disulfide isomerase/thioredoxin